MYIYFKNEELKNCYDFALEMRGNHNPNMIQNRDDWEIFRDDFRGKLGELAVHKYIEENIPNATLSEVDFNVTPRGQWDTTDLIINDMYINVKSIKQGSSFLMIETLRYNPDGTFTYNNNNGDNVKVDYYILVRVTVDPDVQRNIFRQDFNKFIDDGFKNGQSVKRKIYAEILGGISHEDFWTLKHFAPEGIRCDFPNLNHICNGFDCNNVPSPVMPGDNQNNIMQTDNYVISAKDLDSLDNIFILLNNTINPFGEY